ncbi:ejaculatory bulb-specific protein 3-like isoform X3 [Leguminivora glycinivorella]|uniref:ejaculatory bulb-specific protein 3-like isoform X3 n=1 Tax=Leguminivora glycinivorella TaxID=1035111 RepID=UPI00200D99CF|nr:ejaculatory bulb-specific protein 3-like isoform X3 [Leguminivora glycinivorella]
MMMKFLILLCLASALAEDKYTDKYDNIDLDEILDNKRLLQAYVNCILDKGKCTPEGKELKDTIKDAMTTSCEKCTEQQRKGARKVVKHLKENEPEYWTQMKAKYDPGDKYKESYEAFLARDD